MLHRVVEQDDAAIAKDYSHPVQFGVEDLKYLLSTIAYEEKGLFGWSEARSVFTADELYRLGPHLVEAFAQATPDDEVVFQLTSAKPGLIFASERFTNGRLFLKDKNLNCVFANVNLRPDMDSVYDGEPRNYYAGTLWRLVIREGQTLAEGKKGTHYNWLMMDWETILKEKKLRDQARREQLQKRRVLKMKQQQQQRQQETGWTDWESDEVLEPETP
jgi:hypothetical protein